MEGSDFYYIYTQIQIGIALYYCVLSSVALSRSLVHYVIFISYVNDLKIKIKTQLTALHKTSIFVDSISVSLNKTAVYKNCT